MQFSPFGEQQNINDPISDPQHGQLGFSHGLIEGMLVRRGIDRQNKADALNESYNQKLMDMQEQEARDKVTHAALLAHQMQTQNNVDDTYALPMAKAGLDEANLKPGLTQAQIDLAKAHATEIPLTGAATRSNIYDEIRSRKAKDALKTEDATTPSAAVKLALDKGDFSLIAGLSKSDQNKAFDSFQKNGGDITKIPDLNYATKYGSSAASQDVKSDKANQYIQNTADGLDNLIPELNAINASYKGQLPGRFSTWTKASERDPRIKAFVADLNTLAYEAVRSQNQLLARMPPEEVKNMKTALPALNDDNISVSMAAIPVVKRALMRAITNPVGSAGTKKAFSSAPTDSQYSGGPAAAVAIGINGHKIFTDGKKWYDSETNQEVK